MDMSDILCPHEIYDQAGKSAYSSHPLLPDRLDVGGVLAEAGRLRVRHTATSSPVNREPLTFPIPHRDSDADQHPFDNSHPHSERSIDPTHAQRRRRDPLRPADLTRSDLFNPTAALKEDLYNVATSSKKKGIGAYLRYSDGVEAELRLENRFHKLTFNAGQDNNSLSSDLILRVVIYKDRKSDQFVDIPFNEIKPIEVDVTNVNALKIDLIPLNQDGSKYRDSNSITAVMFDMRLE